MFFERPYMFWYLFLLIAPLLYAFFKNIKLSKTNIFLFRTQTDSNLRTERLQKRLYARIACFTLGFICLVFALANPYWGSKTVPVQKVGNSVCFVFDVSYSMNACDSGENRKSSRLESAKLLAQNFLIDKDKVEQIPAVSLVATKGSAEILVPSTEDHNIVKTAIETLNPAHFSSKGTNLAEGIMKAISTFPKNVARQGTIIVFTDGEELEGNVEKAAAQALNHGINLYFIGFGTTKGTMLTLGDGITHVHTNLHETDLKNVCSNISKKMDIQKIKIDYINERSQKKIQEIFDQLYPHFSLEADEYQQLGYEIQKVAHHNLFVFLAIILFLAGYSITRFRINFTSSKSVKEHLKNLFMMALIILPFFSYSCTASFSEVMLVLSGSYYYHQGDFQKAEIKFMKALNSAEENDNQMLKDYSVFALGTSYAMQNEEIASYQRLHSVSNDAPEDLRYAANYNLGVLSYSQGDYSKAQEYFKKSLKIEPYSIESKINYELATIQHKKSIQEKKTKLNSESKNSSSSVLKDTLYSIIRENDFNIWKNQNLQENQQDSLDY